MPEIRNDIALQTQTPDAMKSIGSMLGIAQGAQQLKAGSQQIERGGLALKQEQMDLGERNALRGLASKLKDYMSESGEPDYPRLIDAAVTAAPKHGMEWAQKIAAAHVESVAVQSSLNKLSGEQRSAIGQVVMSVADQPPQVQEQAINAVVEGNPQLKTWGNVALKALRAAGDNPAARKETALKFGQSTMSAGQQAQAITPSGPQVSNNAQSGTMNLNPLAGPTGIVPGTVVDQQLPLGERQNVSINPVNQSPMTTAKDAFGNVTGVTQTPTGPGVPQLKPGEAQEIPIRTQQRASVNAAAAKVPEQHFNNREIIRLAPEAFTGTGSEKLAKLGSLTGMQMLPGDRAGNLQRLGHFMSLQAQANAQAMGAGTDAARAISEQATGSTGWTADAIVSTAKVNDALSTGVDLFNRGMEKAIKNGGNVLSVRDFQNQWSQNFDPKAMQLHNAIQAKDQKEIDEIVKSVGGKGSAGAHMLAAKLRNLETLTKDGALKNQGGP